MNLWRSARHRPWWSRCSDIRSQGRCAAESSLVSLHPEGAYSLVGREEPTSRHSALELAVPLPSERSSAVPSAPPSPKSQGLSLSLGSQISGDVSGHALPRIILFGIEFTEFREFPAIASAGVFCTPSSVPTQARRGEILAVLLASHGPPWL